MPANPGELLRFDDYKGILLNGRGPGLAQSGGSRSRPCILHCLSGDLAADFDAPGSARAARSMRLLRVGASRSLGDPFFRTGRPTALSCVDNAAFVCRLCDRTNRLCTPNSFVFRLACCVTRSARAASALKWG